LEELYALPQYTTSPHDIETSTKEVSNAVVLHSTSHYKGSMKKVVQNIKNIGHSISIKNGFDSKRC